MATPPATSQEPTPDAALCACPKHTTETLYSERHDAYYCRDCRRWCDPACGIPGCEWCAARPPTAADQ